MPSPLLTRHVTSTTKQARRKELPKCPTGVAGLDEITLGGLPRGRPTLIAGGAGSGKTLLATEFLVRGAMEFGEPGVFMSFEETAEALTQNVASLGFDLQDLQKRKLLAIDQVRVDRAEVDETGEYDLEGLFIRLGHAIDTLGARRVVLDTVESLFSGFANVAILRAELRRLFEWLKRKGVTAVITAERGGESLTRQGLEEYVSDCVILLDQRVIDQVTTRRIRVVKYRGSAHGANEYPFLIDEDGISVAPLTALGLQHHASEERVSTGVPGLDAMLGGQGFYRGTTVLVSGTAGTGKTSIGASFVVAACRRGERCLYATFEESEAQLTRNMRSIGVDFGPWIKKGLLKFRAVRPSSLGLEMHLAQLLKLVDAFKPSAIVVDPITALMAAGAVPDVAATLMRLVDHFKHHGVTAVFTSLTHGDTTPESTDVGVSSLMDCWILLRDLERDGERNRALYLLKYRGMPHSNQVREFNLTSHGIELADVLVGPSGILTGSARRAHQVAERTQALAARQEAERRRRALDAKKAAFEAQIKALQAEYEAEVDELRRDTAALDRRTEAVASELHLAQQVRTSGLTTQPSSLGGNSKSGAQERPRKSNRRE